MREDSGLRAFLYAGVGIAALAMAGAGLWRVHADDGLSDEIRLGMRAFGDAGLTIYTPGGLLPDTIPLGVVTTVVAEPDAPFDVVPPVRSVIVALGGDVDFINGLPEVVDPILEVEPEFWSGSATKLEYRTILEGAMLPYSEVDFGGNPGLSVHETLRSIAVADSYYVKGETTAEVKDRFFDVVILDAGLVDGDGNGIPDATALLDPYTVMMGLDGTVTFIHQLGNVVRGEPPFDTTKFMFNTKSGIIEIDTRVPRLDQIIARDPVTYGGFTTGRFLVTVSPDASALLDSPEAADPLEQFDLTDGGSDAPPPHSLFVRTILALADETRGATPEWTFVETLPGNLTIDVRVTGLGVANILEDGMAVYGYQYGLPVTQTGEDILANQNDSGWSFGSVAVLSRLDDESDTRGGVSVTPVPGDDSIEFTGPRATGLFGSNIMPELRTDGGGGSSGCFIATAAYGTPMAAEIQSLRNVRDVYLIDMVLGAAFVDTYYRISPPIARMVAEYPVLKTSLRFILAPLVAVSTWSITPPETLGAFALMLLLFASAAATRVTWARIKKHDA